MCTYMFSLNTYMFKGYSSKGALYISFLALVGFENVASITRRPQVLLAHPHYRIYVEQLGRDSIPKDQR